MLIKKCKAVVVIFFGLHVRQLTLNATGSVDTGVGLRWWIKRFAATEILWREGTKLLSFSFNRAVRSLICILTFGKVGMSMAKAGRAGEGAVDEEGKKNDFQHRVEQDHSGIERIKAAQGRVIAHSCLPVSDDWSGSGSR
jgi:hypothetical protein